MNTFLSRLNTIFAFTLSVMAVLTFLCFMTTAFNDHKRPVEIGTTKVTVKNVPDYSADRERSDLGFVVFDMFVEYKTGDYPLNQVVLWDKIIVRGENAIINLKNANTKYYFWDYGNGLKSNTNVTLFLSWNVIPNAGTLPKVFGEGRHRIQFPNEYTAGRF